MLKQAELMKALFVFYPTAIIKLMGIFAVFLFLTMTGIAQSATISGSTTGLTAPGAIISFDELSLPLLTSVTTQYQSLGASFSPNLTQDFIGSTGTNIDGGILQNFRPIGQDSIPFFIIFSQNVNEAALALITNPGGTATFTALLSGDIVESFSSATNTQQTNNFYGFTGVLFDQIRIEVTGDGNMIMDNLQFTGAAVPLPAALPLLGGALSLLGFFGWRRKRRAVAA